MSEMESSYNAMMCGSIYDCIKWIRLTSNSDNMPFVANLIESEINIRNEGITALKKELELQGLIVAAWKERDRGQVKEREQLKKDLELARGAMRAQDERERVAGDKCGVSALENGCDWPDAVADEVIQLKKDLEIARAERNAAYLRGKRETLDQINGNVDAP